MTTMNNEDPADQSVHKQRVLDTPEEIWLVYGELEHDDTHANLRRDGNVTWCEHQIEASDVRYVRADLLAEALESAAFYRRRCAALGQWQSRMRDPERVIVCDILANGKTLTPAGSRYDVPEPLE